MLIAIAFLSAFGGFAGLCAATRRHRRDIWTTQPAPQVIHVLRASGWIALAAAWAACASRWGPAMGTVAWVCCLPLAAMMWVLPFAYAVRHSLIAGGIAAFLAAALSILGWV